MREYRPMPVPMPMPMPLPMPLPMPMPMPMPMLLLLLFCLLLLLLLLVLLPPLLVLLLVLLVLVLVLLLLLLLLLLLHTSICIWQDSKVVRAHHAPRSGSVSPQSPSCQSASPIHGLQLVGCDVGMCILFVLVGSDCCASMVNTRRGVLITVLTSLLHFFSFIYHHPARPALTGKRARVSRSAKDKTAFPD